MEVGVLKNVKKISKSDLVKIPEEKQFIYIRSVQRLHQLSNELRNFDELSNDVLKLKLKQYHSFFITVEKLNDFLK